MAYNSTYRDREFTQTFAVILFIIIPYFPPPTPPIDFGSSFNHTWYKHGLPVKL